MVGYVVINYIYIRGPFSIVLSAPWRRNSALIIFLWVTLRMYYATAQKFISLIKKKETFKKFLQIKETFVSPYSNVQICLIQRNFVWMKETFFWVYDKNVKIFGHWCFYLRRRDCEKSDEIPSDCPDAGAYASRVSSPRTRWSCNSRGKF